MQGKDWFRAVRPYAPGLNRTVAALLLLAVPLLESCAPPAAVPTAAAATAVPKSAQPPPAATVATAPTVASKAPAAPTELKKATLTYGSVSPSYWPFWVAAEKGLWKSRGVDVELVLTDGATRAVQAVLGGSAQAGFASGFTWLGPAAQGAKVKILATVLPKGQDSLLAQPSIKRPEQLKGGRIGIGSFGDVSHLTAVLMVQKFGLDPDQDVTYLQIGNDVARAAALQSATVDAAPMNATSSEKLIKEFSFSVLVNGQEEGIAFPQVTMGTTTAVFERDPDMLKAMLAGILDGIDWVYSPANEKEAKEMLARMLKITVSDSSIDLSYRLYVTNRLYAVPPLVDLESFKYLQSFTGKFNPEVSALDANALIDDTLLQAALATRKPG